MLLTTRFDYEALLFHPNDCASMQGGKGFASLNLLRLFELDNSTSLTTQLNKLKTIENIIEEVVVVQNPNSNPLDGNLHVIFKNLESKHGMLHKPKMAHD